MNSGNNDNRGEDGAVGKAGCVQPSKVSSGPRYTLRPVVKPLLGTAAPASGAAAPAPAFRAENEDDDGYDPYSDYHDGTAVTPTFEPDPWR